MQRRASYGPTLWLLALALVCPGRTREADSASTSQATSNDSTMARDKGILGDMFHVGYYEGVAVYLRDPRNGYQSAATEAIAVGNTIEPEIGMSVLRSWQTAIAYVYMDGKSEAALDSGYVYDDVFLSGFSWKARLFVLKRTRVKLLVGAELLTAKCRLKSDTTGSLDWHRGMTNDKASGDWVSDWRFGGGISLTLMFRPFRFMSVGLDAGLRLFYSDRLENDKGTVVLLDTDGDAQKLSFSSVGLRAFLALHL